MSEGPRGRSTFPGDSGQCPWAHGVDQLSWVARGRVQWPAGLTRSSGRIEVGSACLLVDQLSQARRARVRVPTGFTSSPGQLVLWSEVPWGRQFPRVTRPRVRRPAGWTSFPGQHEAPIRWPAGSTSSPGRLGLWSNGPRVCPAVPDDLCLALRLRRVVQISRVIQAPDRGPAGSSNIPGDSRSGARVRGVDQLSWVTLARA